MADILNIFNNEKNLTSQIIGDVNIPSKLNNKRILLYSQELTYTGAPIMLLWTTKVLLEAGYSITVWSRAEGPFRREFEKLNIPVFIMPLENIQTISLTEIRSFNFCIINTIVGAPFYEKVHNIIPTLWQIHETNLLEDFFKDNPAWYDIFINAKDEDIVCCGRYTAEYIQNKYNKFIRVLNNCVYEPDLTSLTYEKSDKFVFSFLGRITPIKRLDIVVSAYNALPKKYKNKAILNIAGKYDENEKVKDYIQSL